MTNEKIAGRTLNNWILTFERTLEEMEPFRDLSAWEEGRPLIQYLQRENILPLGPLPVRNFEEFRFYSVILLAHTPHSCDCPNASLSEHAFEGGYQYGELLCELKSRVFEKLGIDKVELADGGVEIFRRVVYDYVRSSLVREPQRDISSLLVGDEKVEFDESVEKMLRQPYWSFVHTQRGNDTTCTLWYGKNTAKIYGLGDRNPLLGVKDSEPVETITLVCSRDWWPLPKPRDRPLEILGAKSAENEDIAVLRKVLGQISAYDTKFRKQAEEEALEKRVKKSRRLMLAGLGLGLATIVGGLTCAGSKTPSEDTINSSNENGAYGK